MNARFRLNSSRIPTVPTAPLCGRVETCVTVARAGVACSSVRNAATWFLGSRVTGFTAKRLRDFYYYYYCRSQTAWSHVVACAIIHHRGSVHKSFLPFFFRDVGKSVVVFLTSDFLLLTLLVSHCTVHDYTVCCVTIKCYPVYNECRRCGSVLLWTARCVQ